MESKKLAFVNLNRRNILTTFSVSSSSEQAQNQLNSSALSHFPRGLTQMSVTKRCLFGSPAEGDTSRLVQEMFAQNRIRGMNLYNFDVQTGQPLNLTPPASPYIGNATGSVQPPPPTPRVGVEEKESEVVESVITTRKMSSDSSTSGRKRRSSRTEEEEEVEAVDKQSANENEGSARKRSRLEEKEEL